jgi:hypothetical protein
MKDQLPAQQQRRTEPRPEGPGRPPPRIHATPIADLADAVRAALLRLCDHPAWALCCTFRETLTACAPDELDALVAAGHLIQVAKRVREGNVSIEAAYQLKPVSVAMCRDWRREQSQAPTGSRAAGAGAS